MRLFGFFHLKGISGQIAALVRGLDRRAASRSSPRLPDHAAGPRRTRRPTAARQLADAALLLGTAPAGERPRLIADIARAFPKLGIESIAPGTRRPSSDSRRPAPARRCAAVSAAATRSSRCRRTAARHRIGIELPDGTMIAGHVDGAAAAPPFWGGPWMMTLLFAVISVTLLGLWAARALAAPLSSFAKAAENFSLDGDAPIRCPSAARKRSARWRGRSTACASGSRG